MSYENQDYVTDRNVVKQAINPENPSPNAITEEDSDDDIQTDDTLDINTRGQTVFFRGYAGCFGFNMGIINGNAIPNNIYFKSLLPSSVTGLLHMAYIMKDFQPLLYNCFFESMMLSERKRILLYNYYK